MIGLGFIFGIATATLQSLSYLFNRHYLTQPERTARQLLVIAHVIMAGFATVGLVILWPDSPLDWSGLWWKVLATGGTYLLGQFGLFYALQHTDASRISPLLGLKILVIAALAILFLDATLSAWQWLAVILTVVAAFVLNFSGGSMPLRAIAAILFTCVCYSLSDMFIRILVAHIDPEHSVKAALLGTCMVYFSLGIIGVALLPLFNTKNPKDWSAALPFSITWFGSMLGMFATIALVNVVFANILQSTRGIISILLAVALIQLGWTELETRTSRAVVLRRTIAAILMTGAIALYLLSPI